MKKIRLCLLLTAFCLVTGCAANIKEGVASLEEENYEEAITYFQKDIEEGRHLDEAYRGMGIACFELGNYQEAVEAFKNALENGTKENATIYSFLGASYLQLENYEDAMTYYNTALEQKDCTEEMKQEVLYNQVAIYQKMGDWNTVKEKVSEYTQAYPDDTRMDKTIDFLETR